jgi:cytochrome c oxidase subunit 2
MIGQDENPARALHKWPRFPKIAKRRAAGVLANFSAVVPGGHSVLDGAASQGRHIERLFSTLFFVCLGVYFLTLLFFAIGGRRSYNPAEKPLPIVKTPEADAVAKWWVGSAVGITTVLVFVILVLSIRTGMYVQDVSAQNSVTVKLTGHQWWWEVTYPDSRADQTIFTANEIHVPVGQRIAVLTNSADVIHSFWAPSITGKRDLIPGYSTAFSFTVDRPGAYRGQCAEFCGLQHAHMGFSVVAESPEDFEAWRQSQLTAAKEPESALTRRGQTVFLTHACVMCHAISGTTAGSHIGPDLTHFASRGEIAAGLLPNNPGSLAGWILDPQRIKPGTTMPPNNLSGDDLEALVTYLESLK